MIGDPLLRGARTGAAPDAPSTRAGSPQSEPVRAQRRGAQHSESARSDEFRGDIEGLRAIAVLAVLLYHARLGPFHGGYVGVDVFFVVSGFLITRLLANEVGRSGTISLSRFWARRARRLLPAATLVVLVTVVATRWMLDPLTQGFVNRSAIASSGFVANILFWTRGGYSQLTLPEPLLHFWSLAVEEQFYLFWPLLMLGVVRSGGHFRRLATTVAATIAVGSFVLCVALTPQHQPFTFYFLPARAWELAAGALIALAGPKLLTARPQARAAGAWIGLVVIGWCLVRFNDPQYSFPGAKAALPVTATVLVIIGGAHAVKGPGALLSVPVMQWIGKRSYSLYLWHFPILVLAAAKWGPLPAWQRVGLLALSFVIAAATFRLLEDPVRRSGWLAERPSRSLGLGAALATTGLLTAVVFASLPQNLTGGGVAQSATIVVSDTDGASATTVVAGSVSSPSVPDDVPDDAPADVNGSTVDPQGWTHENPDALVRLATDNAAALEAAVANEEVPSNLRPALRDAYEDRPAIYADGCVLGGGQTTPGECIYGVPTAATTVVLFGDSHAAQWFPAFEKAARKRGWRLVVMTKQACPTGDVPMQIAGQRNECRRWRDNVLARLSELDPDLLVMASFRYQGTNASMWRDGLDATMRDFRPAAEQVMILGDTPTPTGDVPSCVAAHLGSLSRCNAQRSEAVRDTWLQVDDEISAAHDARLVTTGDWLCGEEECPTVLGDVLLYRDESHLTTVAAELLAPYVEAAVRSGLAG